MRIKFEKGMTPERIADAFINFVRKNNLVIGSVNIYLQTYDENMQVEPFTKKEYLVCEPSKETQKIYEQELINARRKRIRAV